MADRDRPEGVGFDELANLQAGLLDLEEEQRLRARLREDPGALEMSGLLADVRAELADLDDEPLPEDVELRLDDTLRSLSAQGPVESAGASPASDRPAPAEGFGGGRGPSPLAAPLPGWASDAATPPQGFSATGARPDPSGVPSPAPADELAERRARRRRQAVFSVAAALAAVAVVGGVVLGPAGRQPNAPYAGNAPAISAQDLAGEWPGVAATRDLGFLADPAVLSTCLGTAVGDPDPAAVLGGHPIVVDGRAGILLAVRLSPGPPQRIALLVLDPACALPGPRGSGVLAQTVITS